MIYGEELNRGVRKKYLPEPNPLKVELARDASLTAVFEKAKQLFFEEVEVNAESMCLADSGGVLIPVEDRANWSLSSFYQKNRLQPSRYKLYVVVGQEVYKFTMVVLLDNLVSCIILCCLGAGEGD